jgi:ribosomal protein S18 acetylase RimI-like enzyme
MNFELIQATEKDRAYLLELRKSTMVEHLEISGQFLSDEEHEIRLNDAYNCSHMIICESGLIGTLKYREYENRLEIMQIQIFPAFQKNGLGRMVLEQVINSSQPKFIELTVLKENPALKLYERLGFHIIGEDQYEYFMETKH